MQSFKASTQYGDWEGTAAADDAHDSIHQYLKDKGLITPNEFLLGVSFFSTENSIYVRASVFPGEKFESVEKDLAKITGAIPVREIELKLTAEEFLALFKRFDVVLTWHGLALEERGYSTTP